ncbi:MAG: nucleoside recognition domain-containing protein, partial [Sarcina sp.]
LVPFMSCNARLPVYVVFTSVFFPKNAGLVVTSLYLLGIIIAFIIGLLFKNTLFKKDEEPFVIELPEYKIPEVKSILRQLGEKAKGFLRKAGTIIFAMSVVIWFLQSFNFTGMVQDVSHSFLYIIGNFIAPIFAPLGFGDWQASVSLLTGLMAKETVVSTMEVIYKGQLDTMLPLYFTTLSSYAFMVFVLLYTPCVSVIGVMKKEFGTKFTLFSISYQIMVAWIVSYITYTIGCLIF